MSNYSMDCFPSSPLPLNTTFIARCQAAATTPFCWPPNGTRICAPGDDIPFFWPPSYYHPSSRVAVEEDITSSYLFLRNNTGNTTQDFTSYMFERKALPVEGKPNERSMKMYMRERRMDDDVEPYNLAVHEGPTLILVKTAAWTTTSRSYRATSTSRSYRYPSDDDDDGPNLSGGAIAGIVIGVIAGFLLMMVCCCKGRSGANGQRPAKSTMSDAEKNRIVREGVELMEQRRAPGAGMQDGLPTSDGVPREDARGGGGVGDVAPPKYTP